MATRSLATRMWSPTASALCHRLGPGMPAAARSRFGDAIHSQDGNAAWKFSSQSKESTRALLEEAKERVEATRIFKTYPRKLKIMRWTLNLSIAVAAAGLVVGRVNRV